MARMRLLKNAVAEIKSADPNSALTEHALRQMAKTGAVFTTKIGNKYLINLDLLDAYLGNPMSTQTEPVHNNGIRQISEKI